MSIGFVLAIVASGFITGGLARFPLGSGSCSVQNRDIHLLSQALQGLHRRLSL